MKKTLLIILLVLPIVLVVVVAVAGYVAGSVAENVSVEGIQFVDEYFGSPYTDAHVFKLEQGKTASTKVNVLPTTASDKRVTYKSADESICTIDENGVITGVHWGSTTVTATTKDGGFTSVLHVNVTLDVPCGVDLSHNELELVEGEVFVLSAEVDAPVAVNKNVTYESSDLNIVTVDSNGKLKAHKAGTAIITVTTELGEQTDMCIVTVKEGVLPLSFDFEGVEHEYINGYYVVSANVIDLYGCIAVSDVVNINDVKIELVSGNATLNGGILTISGANSIINVRAYVGNKTSPTYLSEISIILR